MTDYLLLRDEWLFTPLRRILVRSEFLAFYGSDRLTGPFCDWWASETCHSGGSSDYLWGTGRFGAWRYISATLSGSWENSWSPSVCLRVTRCSSLRTVGVSRHPDQFNSSGTQSTASIPHIILGRSSTKADLTSIKWEKNCAETGRFGTSPKLEEWFLHHKWSAVVQVAYQSYEGLRVAHVEVSRSHPCQ